MAIHEMKLDFNNLIRLIDETLSADDIEAVHNNAFGIAIGLELLQSYLKDIAQHAIDTEDEFLIEWCKGLLIVREKSNA